MTKSGRFTPERKRELDAQVARLAEQDRLLAAGRMRTASNVFDRYVTASLDDVELPRQRLSTDDFAKYIIARDQLKSLLGIPATVVLRGGNGPGKTYLASALVIEFCNQGRSALYCRAVDFFVMLKSTFGAPGKTVEELERRFRRYELLVLDEIEVRSESVWENNVLRSLIDARYGNIKATVIVTNKTKEELGSYFSNAILSRITDDGAIVNCDWPSLRGGKQ